MTTENTENTETSQSRESSFAAFTTSIEGTTAILSVQLVGSDTPHTATLPLDNFSQEALLAALVDKASLWIRNTANSTKNKTIAERDALLASVVSNLNAGNFSRDRTSSGVSNSAAAIRTRQVVIAQMALTNISRNAGYDLTNEALIAEKIAIYNNLSPAEKRRRSTDRAVIAKIAELFPAAISADNDFDL